jgi:glycosyltransferase involved in cell wall biosynthesis
LFVQSGKQSAEKKLIETLKSLIANPDPRFRLVIAGSLLGDIREQAQVLLDSDERLQFVGWKTPLELTALLCAADVYLQPGSQSATMQTSLCCRCAVVLADIEGHEHYAEGNGWLVRSEQNIASLFDDISKDRIDLCAMKKSSEKLANKKLNYAVLARRVLV